MDELREVERFSGGGLAEAEEAFQRLLPRIERFLHRYLSRFLPSEADLQDAIAEAVQRIWKHRGRFACQGLKPWWGFVARCGRSCALDLLAASRTEELNGDVADPLSDHFESPECRERRDAIMRAADELWLEIPKKWAEPERRRRLLAAQMLVLQQRDWRAICRLLGRGQDGLDRETLERWVSDRATQLDLVYSHLYWDNETLIAWLLRPKSPLTIEEVDEVYREARQSPDAMDGDGRPGWSRLAAILLFRYGILEDSILKRIPGVPPDQLRAELRAWEARMPFASLAREARARLGKRGLPSNLDHAGLWRRLVFQYHYGSELPHRQILARIQPAAEVGEYRLTPGMLNVWLSNGRLIEALKKHLGEEAVHA